MTVKGLSALCVAHAGCGNYDRALADYDEAIRLNPKDANAFYNRGVTHAMKYDNDRAIADYDEAIRLNPKDAKAFNNRGFAYAVKFNYNRPLRIMTRRSDSIQSTLVLFAIDEERS